MESLKWAGTSWLRQVRSSFGLRNNFNAFFHLWTSMDKGRSSRWRSAQEKLPPEMNFLQIYGAQGWSKRILIKGLQIHVVAEGVVLFLSENIKKEGLGITSLSSIVIRPSLWDHKGLWQQNHWGALSIKRNLKNTEKSEAQRRGKAI